MKNLAILLFLSVFSCIAGSETVRHSQEQGDPEINHDAPPKMWSTAEHAIELSTDWISKSSVTLQLGKVPVNHSFMIPMLLKNSTQEQLSFETATSCGCVKVGEQAFSLNEGDNRRMELNVASIAKPGVFEVELKLKDRSSGGIFTVNITGLVTNPFEIHPKTSSVLSTANDRIEIAITARFDGDKILKVGVLGTEVSVDDFIIADDKKSAKISLSPNQHKWGEVSPVLYADTYIFGRTASHLSFEMPDKVSIAPPVVSNRNLSEEKSSKEKGRLSFVIKGKNLNQFASSIKIVMLTKGKDSVGTELEHTVRSRTEDVLVLSVVVDRELFALSDRFEVAGNNSVGPWKKTVFVR
ncbi:MAG: hypothetical protein MUC83_00585 [Pirellula sp.]|jgi:hypothetical protein|nr:hypothetical protein [Pirellula sp.]